MQHHTEDSKMLQEASDHLNGLLDQIDEDRDKNQTCEEVTQGKSPPRPAAMPACGIFGNVFIFASLKHKEMKQQDFHYTSTQNLIVPVVGDVIEDTDGQLWLVVGRTLKPNNVLVVHTEKMEGNE